MKRQNISTGTKWEPGEIRPATSMVEVSRLIEPEMLVEIEADADAAE